MACPELYKIKNKRNKKTNKIQPTNIWNEGRNNPVED